MKKIYLQSLYYFLSNIKIDLIVKYFIKIFIDILKVCQILKKVFIKNSYKMVQKFVRFKNRVKYVIQ